MKKNMDTSNMRRLTIQQILVNDYYDQRIVYIYVYFILFSFFLYLLNQNTMAWGEIFGKPMVESKSKQLKFYEKYKIKNLNIVTKRLIFTKFEINRFVFDNKNRKWKELEHCERKRALTCTFVI